MKKFNTILFLFFSSVTLNAQTSHYVTAGGGGITGIDPYFNPQFITIQQGDTVVWNNIQGIHNVNGTTTLYPDNPESFASGAGAAAPWTYIHVFTIPGFYEYECSMWDHNLTQFGSITVTSNTAIGNHNAQHELISIYPNPFMTKTTVEFKSVHNDYGKLNLMDLTGRIVKTINIGTSSKIVVARGNLKPGIYFVEYIANERAVFRKKLIIQ